ncbi:hypothetical protein HA466_0113820 [Hirschfeldia incana]|nr:hypothetical protein HA466_0113820 [Hirschfeldia incana]KAJ0253747.1 hypothetical protein HA466_0113820 [Hirschfeldia incana]KAJ0253748.1 hypothetical protein HA466_0113820 [Hirschfeldia incana]
MINPIDSPLHSSSMLCIDLKVGETSLIFHSKRDLISLTDRFQNGGTETVEAKAGAGLRSSEVCRCLL